MSDTLTTDLFLEHYGIKGMRWGVRKDSDSQENPQTQKQKRDLSLSNPKVRRAAIVGLTVTAIVAAAFVASKYNTKLSDVESKTVAKGAVEASKIIKKPTDIIYMSKPYKGSGVTKNGQEQTTLRFITKGNTEDFFSVFDKAGLNDTDFRDNEIRKMKNGDVAALVSDLLGRRDAAGRSIPHAVFIPAEQATGLNTIEDVIQKFGPRLEQEYQKHLELARKAST